MFACFSEGRFACFSEGSDRMSKSMEELEKEIDQLRIQADEILKQYKDTRDDLRKYYKNMGLLK